MTLNSANPRYFLTKYNKCPSPYKYVLTYHTPIYIINGKVPFGWITWKIETNKDTYEYFIITCIIFEIVPINYGI